MRKGFTLAEILITLAVIGVVAAIAVPAVLQNTQDIQLKTAWKKAYSDFAQATKLIMNDNGGTLKGLCSTSGALCFRNTYAQYLSFVKTCTWTDSLGNCWHRDNNFYYMNGNPTTNGTFWANDLPAAILSNGTLIYFYYLGGSNCNYYNTNWSTLTLCADIGIDVNGFKGPNRVGKDIFGIHVLEDSILPYGVNEDVSGVILYSSCSNTSFGGGCSAKYLKE